MVWEERYKFLSGLLRESDNLFVEEEGNGFGKTCYDGYLLHHWDGNGRRMYKEGRPPRFFFS